MERSDLIRRLGFGGLYAAGFASGFMNGYCSSQGIDLSVAEQNLLQYAPAGVGIVSGAYLNTLGKETTMGGQISGGFKGGCTFVFGLVGAVCGYTVGKL